MSDLSEHAQRDRRWRDDSVELHLQHGGMLALLRGSGFEVEAERARS